MYGVSPRGRILFDIVITGRGVVRIKRSVEFVKHTMAFLNWYNYARLFISFSMGRPWFRMPESEYPVAEPRSDTYIS